MLLVEGPAAPNRELEPDSSQLERPADSRARLPRPPALPEIAPSSASSARPGRPANEMANAESKPFDDLADTVHGLEHPDSNATDSQQHASEIAGLASGPGDFSEEQPPGESSAIRPPPPDVIMLRGSGSTRRVLLTCVAGAAGVGLAVLFFVWVSRPDSTPATAEVPSAPARRPDDTPAALNPDQDAGQKQANTDFGVDKIDDNGLKNPPQPPTQDTAADPSVASVDASASTMPSPAANALPASPEGSSPPEKPGATAPADLVPADNDQRKADRVVGGGSLAETLRKLGGLVDDSSRQAEPDPASPSSAPENTAEGPLEAPRPDNLRLPRPPPLQVNVSARLNDPILEIEFSGIPLHVFLRHMTAQSTIPMTLDADVLMWMGLSPTTSVSVRQTETTVGKVLEEVLGKLGLNFVARDGHLWITRQAAEGNGRREVQLPMADLAGDDPARLAELRDRIVTLIEPESWEQDTEGAGKLRIDGMTLTVENTEQAVLEVIAFCEKLRVARGLTPRSRFDPKHFQLVTRTQRARPLLNQSVTLNYPYRTSFQRIVQRIGKETGATILIHWQTIADAGWNPMAETTLTVSNEPLSAALDKLLVPMELTYRVIDDATLEITTPAALEARQEIEFYAMAQLVGETTDLNAMQKRLGELVPKEWFHGESGSGLLQYDAASKSLIVSVSQLKHRELEAIFSKRAEAGEK